MRKSAAPSGVLVFVAATLAACASFDQAPPGEAQRANQARGDSLSDTESPSAPPEGVLPAGAPDASGGGQSTPAAASCSGEVKAFPTAEGFGAQSKGGRGGRVIEVTNLDDSGPGSLRACAEEAGPRTCVFRVDGTIELQSVINVSADNSYLTIAGQTAPGDGVQLKNWYLSIAYGAHDVIVRHLRIRPGSDHQPENINNDCGGILLYGPNGGNDTVDNVVIDHSSVAWTCDDSVQAYGAVTNTTYQWNLIAEGLIRTDYTHPVSGEHANSKGMLSGGSAGEVNTVSFHHNLMTDTGTRNPAVGSSTVFDYRNNIGHLWQGCTQNAVFGDLYEQQNNVNFVGNMYITPPDIGCKTGELWGQTRIYVEDNWTPHCAGDCASPTEWSLGFIEGSTNATTYEPASEAKYRASAPFAAPPITMTSLSQLEAVLAANVGATKPVRDALDARIIGEFQSRTGVRGRNGEPYPVLASGTPPADTDKDGIPDAWEGTHGLDPNDPSDGPGLAANGYTNLENYLNELAGDPVCP